MLVWRGVTTPSRRPIPAWNPLPVETVNLFLALLFFGAMAVIVVAIVLGVVRLASGRLPEPAAQLVAEIRPLALVFAWLAPTVAMLGSLYYSEVAGFTPCRLCWVQRAFMYPSAIVMLITLLLRRPKLAWLAFGLSVIGIGVSTYHRLEQQFPNSFSASCDINNPCSGRWVNTFGFVTIPTMAFAAFGLVLVFVPLALLGPKEGTS
jgi:disulfide bond formation protein DsbB